MTSEAVIELVIRCLLVVLFLPFSSLDKILDFKEAVAQARQIAPTNGLAIMLIVTGLAVEIFMSLGIVTGIADRLSAFILGIYCIATATLWKRFWEPDDFWRSGESQGRALFWDFLKNFSVCGGLFLITFGTSDIGIDKFLKHPFASSQPYTSHLQGGSS